MNKEVLIISYQSFNVGRVLIIRKFENVLQNTIQLIKLIVYYAMCRNNNELLFTKRKSL
jgi:hypothetical protein